MEKKEGRDEHERLKLELRRLKRSNAPWYFESALHQRLHGEGSSRLPPYRMPVAISISLGVMALLAVGSYFLLAHTDLFSRLPAGPDGGKNHPAGMDSVLTRPREAAPETGLRPSAGLPGRGPAASGRDSLARRSSTSIPSSAESPRIEGRARRDTAKAEETASPSRRDSIRRENSAPGADTTASRRENENK